MPVDRKYTHLTKTERKGPWRFRFLILFLLTAFLVTALYFGLLYQTRQTNEWILTGHAARATNALERWTWLPLINAHIYEQLGTATLIAQNATSASLFFARAESKYFFKPAKIWEDVLKLLWSNGRYEDGLRYIEHLEKQPPRIEIVRFYNAGFLAGLNALQEAANAVRSIPPLPELSNEIFILQTEIDHRIRTQRYAFLADRNDLTIATVTINKNVTFQVPRIDPLLRNPSGDYLAKLLIADPLNKAVLTLDSRIQNAAITALGGYSGAIVVLNPETGEILAAAGKSDPFHFRFEPGSIVKMVTLSGAIDHGVDLARIFPFTCEGSLKLYEGKILYCAKAHGMVKDVNVATALSCNVAFARIGFAMDPKNLLFNLKQSGFDSTLNEAFLPFKLGRIIPENITDSYVARISIGLDYLEMTPLHAALYAAAIANGGMCMQPRLLLGRKNIIGIPFSTDPPANYRQFMSREAADILIRAMEEVVQNAEGTGHRAAIDGFPFAIKTGTAGEGTQGYNAMILGIAPTPDPKIAFSIFLEHAGKAEFEGARITP